MLNYILSAMGVALFLAIPMILLEPKSEMDQQIRDAMAWDKKQAKLNRAIRGEK